MVDNSHKFTTPAGVALSLCPAFRNLSPLRETAGVRDSSRTQVKSFWGFPDVDSAGIKDDRQADGSNSPIG